LVSWCSRPTRGASLAAVDDDSRIASIYNPKKSMPLSVLIDRAGAIEADVEKALDPAGAPK
jgi:hypothetical protein